MSEEDKREMRRDGRRRIMVMWSMFLVWVHACMQESGMCNAERILRGRVSSALLTLHMQA